VRLSCTPHTDSGILTLLLQDCSGGLEVRNSDGIWVPAPYVRDSLVVNIGDLMAKVSRGRFVATMHRVRRPEAQTQSGTSTGGRLSVPFFFEPGENCLIRAVEGDEEVVVYGRHVRDKMRGFVEFRGLDL
jgi:isopenicillin N synthase-like dioxygenase